VIVAISLLVFASTFVLTRMVGRSFLPNEDMGDFQLVIDTPKGRRWPGWRRRCSG
jgi:multidrug efflux pump subunit AcrB